MISRREELCRVAATNGIQWLSVAHFFRELSKKVPPEVAYRRFCIEHKVVPEDVGATVTHGKYRVIQYSLRDAQREGWLESNGKRGDNRRYRASKKCMEAYGNGQPRHSKAG